jgi:hypothetical protein
MKIPREESLAFFKSWQKWLRRFIRQEIPNSESAAEALEKALVLAAVRACHDVYKRVPDEEEMERGTSIVARKLNHFFSLAKEHFDGGRLLATIERQMKTSNWN